MADFVSVINSTKIPDIWQIGISFAVAVFIVYVIEWLKQPTAEIELIPDLILKDGRKFLKVKVKVSKKEWLKKIFPWQNAAAFAQIKGFLISCCEEKEVILAKYTVKWDRRPEPWDYANNRLRLELLPASSEPENFLPGDEDTASVATKHPNEKHFYIYDANYYVNQKANQRSEEMVKLRLVFSSSSVSTKKDFMIVNANSTTEAFCLKGVEKK